MSEALARSLVLRALKGDRAAVRHLIGALTPVVQARVSRALWAHRSQARGRDLRQETADLIQEVFVALFEKDGKALRAWDPDRGSNLQNFVGLIAERQVMSVLRSRRRNPWSEDPTEQQDMDIRPVAADAEERVASREQLSTLYARLRGQLTPRGLELFELHVVRGRGVPELSAAFDMTPDAIYAWKSRLKRTLKKLHEELKNERRQSDSAAPSRMSTGGRQT